MKKIFSAIISSPLKGKLGGVLFALVATTAFGAPTGFKSGYLCYHITSKVKPYTVEVTWQELNSYKNYSGLTSVTIPETVTHEGITYSVTGINEYAFYRCTSLTSVTIPNSVTTIEADAFKDCFSLTSITIPNSRMSINSYAFLNVSSITSVILTGTSVESFCQGTTNGKLNSLGIQCERCIYINGKEVTKLVIPNNVTSIANSAFRNCSSLTSISIGDSIASIGSYAFSGCSRLTEVVIPNSVTSIDLMAFSGCSSLTSVIWNAKNCSDCLSYAYAPFYNSSSITSFTFGENVEIIPAYLCSGITSLSTITIPTNITNIGQEAFSLCSSLTSIFWNAKNCTSPSSYAESPFYGISSQITSFSIGENIKIIPAYLCCGMKSLPAITIPNSITNIGHCAFADCSSLKSIIIPDNVTAMGANVFGDCVGLHHIEWNVKSCTVYSDNEYIYPIFYGCENVESVTFGKNVETIPDYLCYGMKNLSSISIPNSVTDIEQHAFDDCSLLTSVIWNAKNSINPSSPEESPFYRISSQITSFSIGENVETIPDYLCFGMKILPSITIPNNVTNIGQDAFLACIFLKENFINYSSLDAKLNDYWGAKFYDRELDGLLIRNDTLIGCKLDITSIILPNTITRIEDYAFSSCSTLTSVTIPESVTSIGEGAFYGCSALTSITIPNSVDSIGKSAFRGCSTLTSIYLPYEIPMANKSSFNDYHYEQVKLYVPLEAYEAYKADDVWGNFKDIQYIDNFYANNIHYKYMANGEILSESLLVERNFNKFTTISIIGSQNWHYDSKYGAKMSGYSDSDQRTYQNEDWLISPAMDLSQHSSATLEFSHAFGPKASIPTTTEQKSQYTCWVSNDFDGDVTTATWTELPITYGTSAWSFITTTVDIPAENLKENCRIAWKYVCTNSSATWEIKSVEIGGLYTRPAVQVIAKNDKYSDDIVIPSTVTHNYADYNIQTIAANAFSDCSSLTSVSIGNNVRSIESSAFSGCSSLKSVTLGRKLVNLGEYAFSRCTALNEITLPASVKSIGENAFAGCTKLYDIYCYAMEPPTAYESSFANYNAFLHVPCDNQRVYLLDVLFGNFKFIECIDSEEATTDGKVEVIPGFNDVTITWPTEGNADTYTIVIKKDGEVVCTLTFNSQGQLLNIAFAPGRDGNRPALYAEQAVNGYRFTVNSLTESTRYAYNITTKDAANQTIATYSGEFTTLSGETAVEDILYSTTNTQKLLIDGQLLILRDGKTYNAMGQEVGN